MRKLTTTFALIFLISTLSIAQKLPFQGYLEESGLPVEGTRNFEFSLTAYGWSETKTDIPIENGLYNVVLGETTPLPKNIFNDTTETPLEIIIDGVSIGTVTLYKPLINSASLLTADGNLEITGPNDSLNLRVGSFNPYYGSVNLYDSLGAQQGFLSADPLGGRLQLNQRNTSGSLTSAIVVRATDNTSYSQFYGSNPGGTALARMMENYITPREIAGGPLMSGGYLRSGSDWFDNEGTLLAAIGNARDEAGSDPTGKSGFLSLWGTNSFNVELTGKRWDNNDLPTFQLFGNNDDGNGWWLRNFGVDVNSGQGTTNFANLSLHFTDNAAAINNENVLISSNLFGSAAGGMELRDSLGTTTAILEARGNGNSGQLKIRAANGNDVAAVQNRGGNSGQAVFYGPSSGLRSEIGSFGDDSGFMILYGPNNSKNVQIDRDPGNTDFGQLSLFGTDGITSRVQATARTNGSSEFGFVSVNSPLQAIELNGETSTITAQTVTQVSDRRLKENITPLKGSLEKIISLRGVNFDWKEGEIKETNIGFIAQEVEAVYPEVVHTKNDGFKAVNYAILVAALAEAIEELNAKIDHLEKKNSDLTAALEETKQLSDRIGKLEKLLLEGTKVSSN